MINSVDRRFKDFACGLGTPDVLSSEKDQKKAYKLYTDYLTVKARYGYRSNEARNCRKDMKEYMSMSEYIYGMSLGDIPEVGSKKWEKESLDMQEYQITKDEIEKRFAKLVKK